MRVCDWELGKKGSGNRCTMHAKPELRVCYRHERQLHHAANDGRMTNEELLERIGVTVMLSELGDYPVAEQEERLATKMPLEWKVKRVDHPEPGLTITKGQFQGEYEVEADMGEEFDEEEGITTKEVIEGESALSRREVKRRLENLSKRVELLTQEVCGAPGYTPMTMRVAALGTALNKVEDELGGVKAQLHDVERLQGEILLRASEGQAQLDDLESLHDVSRATLDHHARCLVHHGKRLDMRVTLDELDDRLNGLRASYGDELADDDRLETFQVSRLPHALERLDRLERWRLGQKTAGKTRSALWWVLTTAVPLVAAGWVLTKGFGL